jgi:serine/threonine-protein kinase SRPK3
VAQLLHLDASLPLSSAPRYVVEAINFRNLDSCLLSGLVCIVDFGLSFLTNDAPPGIPATPRSFLAPELCFGAPQSSANDIWALGCLMFELNANCLLFPLIFDRLDILVGTIVDKLGQLPPHWEGHFVLQAHRSLPQGQKDFWYDPSFRSSRPLEGQIAEKCAQFPEEYRRLLLQLLASLLSLDPAGRLCTADIVSHPWFSEGDQCE